MKQKRKETSCLHSNKQCLNAIGTVTLLGVVCGVLGIISVGLLTKSAIAAGDGNTSSVAYTGVDDKIDVVVGLNFIDQNNQSKDLYNFYESGDNLYVTPNNVVVNVTNTNGEILRNNEVIGSVYGHVLGGEGNKLNSDNVTIIAGSSNEIGVGNTNAVLLGGTGNTMGGSEVLALVGGEGNDANKKDGLIIGGNNNTVNGGNGSASVLGGERNEVLGDNAVVGGLGIRMAQSLKNVFAYSNKRIGGGNFITKSSDAFYLDIQKGLGINLESAKGGVEMQGAMGFGEVDINQGCNDTSNNYGVQGTWDGCMVGCTKAGGGKWQLLDSSESCKTKCEDNNSRCVVDVYNPTSVAGRCADSTVSTMHTTKCGTSGSYEQYKNAIFEVTLVDQGKCPGNSDNLGNNQCVYACNAGFHLVEDKTGKVNDERKGKGCYKDCTLYNPDGTVAETLKHNTKTVGYDSNKEYCAYNDGVKNPASTYTCNNHKTELMCVDGKFYKKSGGNWVDNNTKWYKTCELNNYTCTTLYNLSKNDITSTLKDSGTFGKKDRDTFTLTRAKYKLCIDWNAVTKVNGTSCNEKGYKYQFVGCNTADHYENVGGNVCKKQCKYGTEWVSNGATRTFYSSSSETCMNECGNKGKSLKCDDGEWGTVSDRNTYKYLSCSQKPGNSCEGFNVSAGSKEEGKTYDECIKEFTVGESCSSVKKYKLVDNPELEPTGEPKCTDLPSNAKYNDSSKKPSSDTKAFHNTSSTKACAFSCENEGVDYEWKNGECKKISGPEPDPVTPGDGECTYKIKYDCNGGSGSPESDTVVFGEYINLKSEGCNKMDYILTGRSLSSNATTSTWALGEEIDGELVKKCENKTVYAVYVKDERHDDPFFPAMNIDEIEGCKMKYHFNEYDPISGKSCCNPVRLMKSYDGNSWDLLQTDYKKDGTIVTSKGKQGTIYFKYSTDGGSTYSPVYSYNMSKQTGCSSSCSLQKVDWNGNPFDWEEKTVYYDYGFIWSAPVEKYKDCISGKTDYNWDGFPTVGDCIWSTREVKGGYIPCSVKSAKKWCYFENTRPEGKITKTNNYIGDLYKCI